VTGHIIALIGYTSQEKSLSSEKSLEIGSNQVVDYTYPDPMYLDHTDIPLAIANNGKQV
jgi:hypothetical protein